MKTNLNFLNDVKSCSLTLNLCVVLKWNVHHSLTQIIRADASDGAVVVSSRHGDDAVHCLDAARARD